MSAEQTLETANELMRRELNRPPRDAKFDAESVASFYKTLIDEMLDPETAKQLAIAYVMRI